VAVNESNFEPSRAANSTNILLHSLRRWWLLVIGGTVGALIGFFLYSTQAPTYQSASQINVTRRASVQILPGTGGYGFEDYLSGQIDTMRSDSVLLPASRSPILKNASPEFQAKLQLDQNTPLRDQQVAKMLKDKLVAIRSREITGVAAINNSTINLTFTDANKVDAKLVLEAVISSYVQLLQARSKSTVAERVEQLTSTLKSLKNGLEQKTKQKVDRENERQNITPEASELISGRWSKSKEELYQLTQLYQENESTLETIKKAGQNKTERKRLFVVLTGARGTYTETSQVETQLLLLEQRRKLLSETVGKDHYQMKEVLSQIEFLKSDIGRNKSGEEDADELKQQELFLLQKNIGIKKQIDILNRRINEDYMYIKQMQPILSDLKAIDLEISQAGALIAESNRELESAQAVARATNDSGGYSAEILNKPTEGTKVGPVLLTWLTPAAFLGIVLGLLGAVLLELQDKSFRSPEEIRARLNAPIMGHVPPIRTKQANDAGTPEDIDPTLVTIVRQRSTEAEAYRGVRTQVIQATENNGNKVLQITSPSPGDGKSTLAANLAISLAQAGKKTILIDCDFRKPRVHKIFKIDKPKLGLASVTNDEAELKEAIHQSPVPNLDLLPCGPRPANPAELLSSTRYQELLTQLKGMYDYVIIDTPPLLAVSDPRVVAQRADAVVMVFKISKKVRPLAQRAKEFLDDIGANVIGVVINSTDVEEEQYGYGYGYAYSKKYGYEYAYAETYEDDQSKF
jgi:capsular exopolysaccharide synthesis family protein